MASSGAISAARVADLERQLAVAEAARIEAESRLATSEDARSRLERMLAQLRRDKFGATSEKAHPDQQHLPFEDVRHWFEQWSSEVAEGRLAEASKEAEKAFGDRKKNPRSSRRNKGHLPPHLERVEQIIEPDTTLCPCGCGEMVKVGEDRSERLDVIPARFRVLVTVRPKYVCRSCDGASHVQAPAPEWLVPRGLPTEALVAHSMVSKFGDYLPFYRQADIYRRQGIDLDRSMLANWSGRAAQLLDPIIDHMITTLKRSDHLQMDETTVPVLAPGTGKVRKDYLWAILRISGGGAATIRPSWCSITPEVAAARSPGTS